MGKHNIDNTIINRNKTLQNICDIFANLSVGVVCTSQEEKREVRKTILKYIQKWIGVKKRTAYDYLLAVEEIMGNCPLASREAILGGKKEHSTWEEVK